jgi:hypothetical protein
MIHEQEELQDVPRFSLTDTLHWESGRGIVSAHKLEVCHVHCSWLAKASTSSGILAMYVAILFPDQFHD